MTNEIEWKEVSRDEFFVAMRQDVHPQSQNSSYPCTMIWKTPTREEKGKTVDYGDGGTIKTKYYLPN
jgi:hypothetical protein